MVAGLMLDFNNAMSVRVGAEGMRNEEWNAIAPRVANAVDGLAADRARHRSSDMLEWLDLPYSMPPVVRLIEAHRTKRSFSCTDLVVCGIGGSALGPIAVHTALRHSLWNISDSARNGRPRLHVADNIDPAVFYELIATLPLETTLFTIITKSGATAETMAQFLIVTNELAKKVGPVKLKEHLIFVTDPAKGLLRSAGFSLDVETYDVPEGVGGRFSVLSPVGLVSAVYTGVDVQEMLQGAENMDNACRATDMSKNPAAAYAAIMYLLDTQRHKPIHVMMPYASPLRDVADWFRQLWAESLGKKVDRSGREIRTGPTPVKSLGATDQHSQVQLYVEGPRDKVVTILAAREHAHSMPIPSANATLQRIKEIGSLAFLENRSMAELLEAERIGTTVALTESGCPNITIHMDRIDARTLGALFFFFELATAYYGRLLDINAFDQPGVEAGKVAAFALMGHKKYTERRRQLDSAAPPDRRFVIE